MIGAEVFVAHVLAFHLAVPEPVSFRLVDRPEGVARVKYTATITWDALPWDGYGRAGWLISYDRQLWEFSTDPRRRFILAHELCHAAFFPSLWAPIDRGGLTRKQRRKIERQVDQCATDVLRRHIDCHRMGER